MTDIERFFKYVNKTETCWLWIGGCGGSRPYGQFYTEGKTVRAHRFSYRAFVGEIPPGLLVCHHCDVTRCVKPGHLFVGTMSDNINDAIKKGRISPIGKRGYIPWHKNKTHCKYGHEFTDATTIIDRKAGRKKCRLCARKRDIVRSWKRRHPGIDYATREKWVGNNQQEGRTA